MKLRHFDLQRITAKVTAKKENPFQLFSEKYGDYKGKQTCILRKAFREFNSRTPFIIS